MSKLYKQTLLTHKTPKTYIIHYTRSTTRGTEAENRSDQKYNATTHMDLDLVHVDILSLDLIQ